MQVAIKVKDKKQFEVIIGMLLASDRSFAPHRKSEETPASYADDLYFHYPYPLVEDHYINATFDVSTRKVLNWPEQAEEIVSLIFKKSYKMHDLCDYFAEVTKDGIKVGCQTIPFDKFEKLVTLVNEFKNEN